MKLEVIERSSSIPVKTYVVPDLSLLSFSEWKDVTSLEIPLGKFSSIARSLNSVDRAIEDTSWVPMPVSFYLPDPIERAVVQHLQEQQVDLEKVRVPDLELISIISVIADEISANHLPNEAYEVRISE